MSDTLYDDKLAGEITVTKYKQKLAQITSQKADLEEKLASIETDAGVRLDQKLVILELSQKAAKLYPNKTPDQKRLIITKLFNDLTYEVDSVSVMYTNFCRAIANNVQKTRKLIGGEK
jgi:acetolactate synthase small subunit